MAGKFPFHISRHRSDTVQICKTGSSYKAMFHTAAVWVTSTPLDTGNYVPAGQDPIMNMAEGRM